MSDLMLYGVLRMPYDMAMSDEMSRRQFYSRVQEALSRMEVAEAKLEELSRATPPSPSTAEGYGPVRVVGDLVRNLLTLDQSAPIFAAFHLDIDGQRRCRTRAIHTSWERVVDGKWVDSARVDVPYSVIVWAKPDERTTTLPVSSAAPIAEGEREAFEALFSTLHPAARLPAARLFERVVSDERYCSMEVEYAWQTYRALASRPAAREAARQSICEDQKFRELLDEFAYRASERRAMGGDFGSAEAEEVAETDLIAYIDTWGGAALAANTATQKERS